MSELIILAAFAFAAIAALVCALVILARTLEAMQAEQRAERERVLTAIMARTVTEYAVAESKIRSADKPAEPRPDPMMYETVGGVT